MYVPVTANYNFNGMFLKGGLFPGCDIKISFSTTSFKNSFVVTVLHDWCE